MPSEDCKTSGAGSQSTGNTPPACWLREGAWRSTDSTPSSGAVPADWSRMLWRCGAMSPVEYSGKAQRLHSAARPDAIEQVQVFYRTSFNQIGVCPNGRPGPGRSRGNMEGGHDNISRGNVALCQSTAPPVSGDVKRPRRCGVELIYSYVAQVTSLAWSLLLP